MKNLGQTIALYLESGECDADAREFARERAGEDKGLDVLLRRWYMGTKDFAIAVDDIMSGERTIVDGES